ncbi:MAG: hypothetical protein ACOCXQ_01940 [Patescibacteria group bacterium]
MIPVESVQSNPSVPTDLMWEYSLAVQSGDEQSKKMTREKIEQQVRQEASELTNLITIWRYAELVKRFGNPDIHLPYTGPKPEGVRVEPDQRQFVDNVIRLIYSEEADYLQLIRQISSVYYPVEYTYQLPIGAPVQETMSSPETIFELAVQPNREYKRRFEFYFDLRADTQGNLLHLSDRSAEPVIYTNLPDCEDCRTNPPTQKDVMNYLMGR